MTEIEKIIYSSLPRAIGLLSGIESGLDLCIKTSLPPNVPGMKRTIIEARTIIEQSQKTLQKIHE